MPAEISILFKTAPKNITSTAKRTVQSKDMQELKEQGQAEVHAALEAPHIVALEKLERSLNIVLPFFRIFKGFLNLKYISNYMLFLSFCQQNIEISTNLTNSPFVFFCFNVLKCRYVSGFNRALVSEA